MNQVLELYKNALDRLTAAKGVNDKNEQRAAISYTFNTILNNPSVSEKLSERVAKWKLAEGRVIPDEIVGPTLGDLHHTMNVAYDRIKKEVDEDMQLAQQPIPGDNPGLTPAKNLKPIVGALRNESTLSMFKHIARIAIAKINANPNGFAGRIQDDVLPKLAQRLETASTTDRDNRFMMLKGILGSLKENLIFLIQRQDQDAQNDVNMALDGGRKKRRGKKTKKNRSKNKKTRKTK